MQYALIILVGAVFQGMTTSKYTLMTVAALSFVFVCASAIAVQPGRSYFTLGTGYSVNFSTMLSGNSTNLSAPDGLLYSKRTVMKSDVKHMRGFDLAVALGHNFTESVRVDITLERLRQHSRVELDSVSDGASDASSGKDVLDGFSLVRSSVVFSTNAYYDLNMWSARTNFTPFLTCGVGVERSRYIQKGWGTTSMKTSDGKVYVLSRYVLAADGKTETFDVKNVSNQQPLAELKSESRVSAFYQGGVGVAYNVSEGLYLDLVYGLATVPHGGMSKSYVVTDWERVIEIGGKNDGQGTKADVVTQTQSAQEKKNVVPVAKFIRARTYSALSMEKSYRNAITVGLRMQF